MRGALVSGFFVAVAWLLLSPAPAEAWGPATHVALGELILNSLYLLPPAVRLLLERHPIHFLYGSVAADISFAKKYVPEGRHSHNWSVGEEVFSSAPNPPLQAMGYGYLAHLAADTLAHNVFVPRRLFLTPTGKTHGHTFWEHTMDLRVGEEFLGKARRLVLNHDHSEADAYFDEILSRTLFSFKTNRRIFRGMIQVQDNDRWKLVFDRVLGSSRYRLTEDRVETYMGYAFDYIVDYLSNGGGSRPRSMDPVGALNLRIAKKLRKAGMAEGGSDNPEVLDALADRFFPLPSSPLLYWPKAKAMGDRALLTGSSALKGLPSPLEETGGTHAGPKNAEEKDADPAKTGATQPDPA
jgi:hypothetical protein